MMRPFLTQIATGGTLSRTDAAEAMHLLMRGEATPEAIGALLVGLAARGETVEELVGFTEVMRSYAIQPELHPDAIDLCGTGGDRTGTINISTAASLVVAGTGIPVAKHGNRSVSSLAGSADVLEALGVQVTLGKEGVEQVFAETGIAFLFAPYFHPALKHVMPVRRSLGVRTFFNILGPLCNPAGVKRQLVGAFSLDAARIMASILAETGTTHALVVHAADGLDEFSTASHTHVLEVRPNAVSERTFHPSDAGLPTYPLEALKGGTAEDNAHLLRDLLLGKPGPIRTAVLLNAAHAVLVSGRTSDLAEALSLCAESIDSGAAQDVLHRLTAASERAPRA